MPRALAPATAARNIPQKAVYVYYPRFSLQVTILIEKVSVPRGIRKLRLRLRGAVLSGAFKDALEGLGLDTYLPV